jgi:hypothetical protein
MLTEPTVLNPNIAVTLERWHAMVANRDLTQLAALVHPDAVFRSPVAFNPYAPAPALIMALQTVMTVFEDFTYHRQFAGDDGCSIVLEFSARVGDKKLRGIDMIRFSDDGLIQEFEVMVRPQNGLAALGAEMGARLGQYLPAYKAKT